MNLLMLALGLQEELFFLPRVEAGRVELCLKDLQPMAGVVGWKEQRLLHAVLQRSSTGSKKKAQL